MKTFFLCEYWPYGHSSSEAYKIGYDSLLQLVRRAICEHVAEANFYVVSVAEGRRKVARLLNWNWADEPELHVRTAEGVKCLILKRDGIEDWGYLGRA